MVRSNDPASVGAAFDIAKQAPHRLEPADMRLGKGLAYVRVVAQMGVNIVAPAVRGSDGGDRSVDRPDRRGTWHHTDDRPVGQRFDGIASADIDIVACDHRLHRPADSGDR